MARFFAQVLVLTAIVLVSHACRCIRPPMLKKDYFREVAAGRRYAKAKVLHATKAANQNSKITYRLRVDFVYDGCTDPIPKYHLATTSAGESQCGVKLQLQETYLLPLEKDGSTSSINSCQFIRLVSLLNREETEFLRTRSLKDCDGGVVCAGGQTPNFCIPVCGPTPPCKEAQVCKLNFCADCTSEWFTNEGVPACLK